MAKFKVGDKVTLSDMFYTDCPSTELTPWVNKLKAKIEEDGYFIITDVVSKNGPCRYKNDDEDIDVYLCEEWLEPYSPNIEQGPLTLLTEDGLSVRDRFAMAALMCFRADFFTAPEYVAEKAYKVADAMMEVRKI